MNASRCGDHVRAEAGRSELTDEVEEEVVVVEDCAQHPDWTHTTGKFQLGSICIYHFIKLFGALLLRSAGI